MSESTITPDAPSAAPSGPSDGKSGGKRSSTPKRSSQTGRTAAERLADNDQALRTGKRAEKPKATEQKPPRFDDRITEAVRYARHELHAKRPGLKDGQRPAASSGGDHLAVRAKVTKLVGVPVSADKLLKLVGGLTLPKLERVARFDPDSTEDMKALRTLGREFKEDGNAAWRQGRYLAGIVAAYVVELRAAEKAGKK